MTRTLSGIAIAVVVSLPALGCREKQSAQKEAEEAAKQLEKRASAMFEKGSNKDGAKAIEALQKAAETMQKASAEGAKVELIDFRELKALLPETIAGMNRTDISGEKTGAFGMHVSTAEATYQDGKGAAIETRVSDLGGIGAVGAMAQLSWAAADFDRETDRGYEKTTKFEGFKAMEEYDKEARSGHLRVILKNRFLVEVSGDNVSMDLVKSAMKSIPLTKLRAMGK